MLACVNHGMLGPHPERGGRALYGYKDVQRQLQGLTDDEMKRIPVLPEGSKLEQGATYLDLRDENAQAVRATGGMTAGHDSLIILK